MKKNLDFMILWRRSRCRRRERVRCRQGHRWNIGVGGQRRVGRIACGGGGIGHGTGDGRRSSLRWSQGRSCRGRKTRQDKQRAGLNKGRGWP